MNRRLLLFIVVIAAVIVAGYYFWDRAIIPKAPDEIETKVELPTPPISVDPTVEAEENQQE